MKMINYSNNFTYITLEQSKISSSNSNSTFECITLYKFFITANFGSPRKFPIWISKICWNIYKKSRNFHNCVN